MTLLCMLYSRRESLSLQTTSDPANFRVFASLACSESSFTCQCETQFIYLQPSLDGKFVTTCLRQIDAHDFDSPQALCVTCPYFALACCFVFASHTDLLSNPLWHCSVVQVSRRCRLFTGANNNQWVVDWCWLNPSTSPQITLTKCPTVWMLAYATKQV